MAKTKSAGSTRLGRDSQPKYLGVKLYAGQLAKAGNVLVKQRGSRFWPGLNVKQGKDDTLYATSAGRVAFRTITKTRFDGRKVKTKVIDILTQ